jgi:hypothetical protein
MHLIFYSLWRDRDGPVDRIERLGNPTTQHLRCGQRPKRRPVARVGLDHTADDADRLVEPPGAQQELAGVQRILSIFRRK